MNVLFAACLLFSGLCPQDLSMSPSCPYPKGSSHSSSDLAHSESTKLLNQGLWSHLCSLAEPCIRRTSLTRHGPLTQDSSAESSPEAMCLHTWSTDDYVWRLSLMTSLGNIKGTKSLWASWLCSICHSLLMHSDPSSRILRPHCTAIIVSGSDSQSHAKSTLENCRGSLDAAATNC